MFGAAIRRASVEPVDPADLQPKFNRPVAQRYFFPQPGVVTAVEGAEAFADDPDVAYLELRVKPHDRIGPLDSHPARVGVVITTGETREGAMALAEDVVERILITTDNNG